MLCTKTSMVFASLKHRLIECCAAATVTKASI